MPVSDTFIEKDSSIDEEIDKLRIKPQLLCQVKRWIIIASVSCIYGLGSRGLIKIYLCLLKLVM